MGTQTFSEIREGGFAYVDKTAYVWKLAHESGKSFFLSRPRRFGKSLFLSTIQSYFEGRSDLFHGLAVEHLEQDWISYPVLRFDLSTVKTTEAKTLRDQLGQVLSGLEREYGQGDGVTIGGRLQSLIERAHEKTGEKVVVLVDEYDAPLLNVLDDAYVLDDFRMVMREFFIPLKACDEHLRFVFLTGITKFSQLSIFSELNNLRDISMNSECAGICGITEDELAVELGSDIDALADKLGVSYEEMTSLLREHYDGYRFCAESVGVYNPFSLMSAFAEGSVKSF